MIRLAVLPLLLSLTVPALAQAAKPRFIAVDLIAQSAEPRPGQTTLVGLRMIPKAGWHSYWSNPGEAGFPTLVDWKAPAGVSFGPLRHPAPSLLRVADMTSYVHEGPHVLVASMTLDRSVAPGTAIPVTAEVSWASCSDKACVPEKATLSMQLTAGSGAASAEAPLLKRAAAREPKLIAGGRFDVDEGRVILELPERAKLVRAKTRFFPDENGAVDLAGGKVIATAPLRLALPVAGSVPKVLTGVATDGSSAYRLRLEREAIEAEEVATKASKPMAEIPQEIDVVPASAPSEAPEASFVEPRPVEANEQGSKALLAGGAALLAALLLGALLLFRRKRAGLS